MGIENVLSEYLKNTFLKDSGKLAPQEVAYFDRVSETMAETDAVISLNKLCDFMQQYYGKARLSSWMSMIRPCRKHM